MQQDQGKVGGKGITRVKRALKSLSARAMVHALPLRVLGLLTGSVYSEGGLSTETANASTLLPKHA